MRGDASGILSGVRLVSTTFSLPLQQRKEIGLIRSNPASQPRLSSRGRAAALIFPLLVVGLLVGGCRGVDPDVERPATDDTGTRIALEPAAAVGCSDCGTDAQITPTVITLLEDGGVVVLDRFEPFVRIFTADGQPSTSFGSPGQGPGELGTNTGGMYFPGIHLLPWPDGTLSVLELIPPVLETFTADGTFEQQDTLDLPMSAHASSQAFAPATGTYFRHSFNVLSDDPDIIERCVIDPGAASDCGQLITATALTGVAPEGRRASLSLATTPRGELIVADAATYRLWLLDPSGDVSREFGRDIPPPPKSEDQLQAEREANRQRLESGRDERQIDPDRPHIAASGLQVDGAGRIWVLTQRYTETSWVLDVLDESGTFLNEVVLEAATVLDGYQITPFAVSGDRLAILANQPDGSARIEVFRIVVSAAGQSGAPHQTDQNATS